MKNGTIYFLLFVWSVIFFLLGVEIGADNAKIQSDVENVPICPICEEERPIYMLDCHKYIGAFS